MGVGTDDDLAGAGIGFGDQLVAHPLSHLAEHGTALCSEAAQGHVVVGQLLGGDGRGMVEEQHRPVCSGQ